MLASKFGWVIDGSSGTDVRVNYDMPGLRAGVFPLSRVRLLTERADQAHDRFTLRQNLV